MIWATSCPVAGLGLLGPTDQPRRRPLGMRAVGARHVFGMGGRLPVVAPLVRRQSLAAIEDLDRVRGVADLDLLADQLERHAVDVALDVDVVVDVDAAPLPVRQDVTRGRQGPQRRAIDLLVQGAAADAQLLHGPVVELVEQDADRRVQRAELEEGLVTETGEYPPLCYEHTILDRSLIRARFSRPRRDHDRVVVGGQILVGAVDVRLVAARAGDGALELVGDPQRGGAAEVLHHAGVYVHPVRQLLGLGRLDVGEAAGAEHGDEQLHGSRFTRAPVDQRRPLAGEVDERLLAGPVHLPHRRPQPPRPLPVDLAELRAAVAVRMDLGVLLPQQLQRDAVALELAVDIRAVGPDPVVHRAARGNNRTLDGPRRPDRPATASRAHVAPPSADSD